MRKRHTKAGGTVPDHSDLPDRGDYLPKTKRVRKRKDPKVDYPNDPKYAVEKDVADAMVNKAVEGESKVTAVSAFPEQPAPVADASEAVGKHMDAMGSYQQEYLLKLVHRMLLRNMPLSTIADTINKSVQKVRELRTELYKRLAVEAANFDTPTHVGESMAFFQEVRGVAMRIATDAKQQGSARVGALNVALEAQKDTIRFMQAIGAYEANPMQFNNQDDPMLAKGDLLQEMAELFLTGEDDDITDVVFDSQGNQLDDEDEDFRLLGGS